MIELERWPAGSRLAIEAELTAELGFSRTVPREAIGRLETIGLVRVRHGQGMFVAPRSRWRRAPTPPAMEQPRATFAASAWHAHVPGSHPEIRALWNGLPRIVGIASVLAEVPAARSGAPGRPGDKTTPATFGGEVDAAPCRNKTQFCQVTVLGGPVAVNS